MADWLAGCALTVVAVTVTSAGAGDLPTPSDAVRRIPTIEKKVALTFDAHDGHMGTQALLDILREEKVRCTMFFTGYYVKTFPGFVRRVVQDGHEIGNHTMDHYDLPEKIKRLTAAQAGQLISSQLTEPPKLLYQLTGLTMVPFWRPPYGTHNGEIRTLAARLGWRCFCWTDGKKLEDRLDLMNWVVDPSHPWYLTNAHVLSRVLEYERRHSDGLRGAILLGHLHDLKPRERLRDVLHRLIQEVRGRGYTFATLSELASPPT